MKYIGLSLIIVSQILAISFSKLSKNPFKHVIVLMMENHSYDNMLGYNPAPIGDLNEKQYCNTDDKGQTYCTAPGANYQTEPDPLHLFANVQQQLYNTHDWPKGDAAKTESANMEGFATSYRRRLGDPQEIFNGFTPEQVPVISSLAQNFANFDRWFSSIPSCTDPNKVFVHAATSMGNTGNCIGLWYCSGWPMKHQTIQDQLLAEGYSWKIHWMDWCEAMAISPMNEQKQNFVFDEQYEILYKDIKEGNLSDYTYLVPRFTTSKIPDPKNPDEKITLWANTQHPSEDIRNGEELIKEIYDNLRSSQYWEDTLFLVVYDEHGGFFDHEIPPVNVSNPSPGVQSGVSGFDFDRLGVRVPSIAISPWLKQGVYSTQHEHSSIPHTIREIFDLKAGPLTIRDFENSSFINDDMILDEMRTDCPETLPNVPGFDKEPRKETQVEMNGTPKTQVYLLGKLLLEYAKIDEIVYEKIVDMIKNDQQAMEFAKEAQMVLGYVPIRKGYKFKYIPQSSQKYQEGIEIIEL